MALVNKAGVKIGFDSHRPLQNRIDKALFLQGFIVSASMPTHSVALDIRQLDLSCEHLTGSSHHIMRYPRFQSFSS